MSQNLYELIFFILCNRTVKLFSKELAKGDNFIPVSWVEKKASKIKMFQSGIGTSEGLKVRKN